MRIRALKVVGSISLALLLALVGALVTAAWAPDQTVDSLRGRWAPPPSTFVDVGTFKVHLRDEGPRDDPFPIVLLHGTSSSLHTWEGWAQRLKGTRRVIRFDLPGFGLTGPSADGVYTIESYVKFVIAVLDSLGVQKAVLGGNSLGGYVAWETAATHPQRIVKLILVDSAGYAPSEHSVPIGFRIAQTPLLNRLALVTLPRSIVESSVRNVYGDPTRVTTDVVDRYYQLTLREGNRASLVARFQQAPAGQHASDITKVTIPTLILWGGKDRLLPPEHADWFHRDIAGSVVVRLDDLGHVPQEEDPERSLSALQHFLD